MVSTSSFEKQHKEEKNTLLLKTQKSIQSQNIKKSKKLKKKQQEAAAEGPELIKEENKYDEKTKAYQPHNASGTEGKPTNLCNGHETNIYNHYHNQVIH